MGTASFRFQILGPIACDCGSGPLALGGPRQVRLLALLLVNANRAVSNDQLIEALWGPERSAGAAKRLQVAVARLRRALDSCRGSATGEPPLQTVRGGYRLCVDTRELDAGAFTERVKHGRRALDAGEPAVAAEFLRAALALWRGPALAEVAFEPFAQGEIRRLEELRLGALEARLEADLLLGRHAELVSELDALVSEHPTRESFTRQLMLALYRCGRQADALEAYQRARTSLAEQLGLEPGPVLRSMQTRVLAQDAALDLRRDPVAVASPEPIRHGFERAFLIVRAGHEEQRVVRLDGRRQLMLGRERTADIPLTWDHRISRLHALLECDGHRWTLSDDGLSSNGTFCNGERVHDPLRLRDGDRLQLGETTLVFRDPALARDNGTLITGEAA